MAEIAVEEYERWYTPQEVLNALPDSWRWETCVRLIAQNMGDGLVRTAAFKVVSSRETLDYFLLPPTIWKHWACLADPDFWNAGLRQVYSDQTGYDGPSFTAHRVRLEPSGVAELAPGQMRLPPRDNDAPQATPATVVKDRPQKVNRAALETWVRDFCDRNPDASFRVVLTNARLHFPNLHVAEMPVKQTIAKLGLTKPRGNPAITRKKR